MPRDASGNYTLPIAPFVPLTLAKSGEMNTALSDIAAALTDSQSRASPPPAQSDLNLNGHNILNLGSVVGDLDTTGTLTVGGSASIASGLTVSGGASFGNTLSALGLITSTASITGQLTAGTLVSSANLTAGGNAAITGTLSAGATTITGAATITGATTITGTVRASSYVLGRAVMAYAPGTNGGFVGSICDASNVGFWNESGILTWSSADGAGVPIANTTRMTLNASNNLIVYGDVYALGAMHANGSGVYYPGLPNGAAHGIGFVWTTGGQLDVYIDKTRYGAVAVNFTDRDDEIAELRAMVAALEARVAALE